MFSIYFGTAQDKLMPAFYLNLPPEPFILDIEPFSKLRKAMHLEELMFLHQTHSDKGVVIDEPTLIQSRPFKLDGDFLITQLNHVGIGVMTGDCLPIVYHDRVHNVAAIAHAGWRGSVLGVAVKTIERMYETYGTKADQLSVFFGPSAKVCCYKVSADFKQHLEGFAHPEKVLIEHGNELYFDLPGFNRLQLEAIGIKKEAIHLDYNCCTMCKDDVFYSHRRQGELAGRQMTVVCLT